MAGWLTICKWRIQPQHTSVIWSGILPQLYTLGVTWSHITKPAHKLAIIFLIFMFCIEFQPNKTPTLVISDVPQRMKSSIFSFIYNWGLLSRTKRKESKNIFYSLNCMRRFLKIWRFFLLVRIWRRQIENQTLDVIVSEAVLGSNNCTHSMQTCFHSSHLI